MESQKTQFGCLMAPPKAHFIPGVLLAIPQYLTGTGMAAGHSSVVMGNWEEENRGTSRME